MTSLLSPVKTQKIELSDLSEVWPEGRGDASDVLRLEASADDRKGVAP